MTRGRSCCHRSEAERPDFLTGGLSRVAEAEDEAADRQISHHLDGKPARIVSQPNREVVPQRRAALADNRRLQAPGTDVSERDADALERTHVELDTIVCAVVAHGNGDSVAWMHR